MTSNIVVRCGFYPDRVNVEYEFRCKDLNATINECALRHAGESKKPKVFVIKTMGDLVKVENQYGELVDVVDTQWAQIAHTQGELRKRGLVYQPENRAIRPLDGFIKN